MKETHLIKGTALNNVKKYITATAGEDTFKEIIAKVNLSNRNLILASNWYPVEVYLEVLDRGAKALGLTRKQLNQRAGKYILETDLNGVYKFFLRVTGSQGVLGKMGSLATTYLNCVEDYQVIENTSGKFVASFSVPSYLCDWFTNGTEGGIWGILSVCKAKFESFSVLDRQVNGSMTQITYEVRYS